MNSIAPLPRDVARCNGDGCDRRLSCIRHLSLVEAFKQEPIPFTLMIAPGPKDCKYFIEAKYND